MDNKVYRIHRGKLTVGTTESRMPDFVTTHWFEAGRDMPHTADVVAAVREIATRCAPEINILVGPQMWGLCEKSDTDGYACRANIVFIENGTVAYQHRGVSYSTLGLIMLGSDDTLPIATATIHHEIMHGMEKHFHPEDFELINSVAGRGNSRPGDYLDSPVERRARLYEWHAMAWDEGARPPAICGVPISRADRILWHLYTGGLAKEAASGRPPQPQLFPGQHSLRWLRGAYREIGWQGALVASLALFTVGRLWGIGF